MLSIKNSNNLLDSASWKRYPEPVFKQSVSNGVYASVRNSFFKSPDGTEGWIFYHANDKPDRVVEETVHQERKNSIGTLMVTPNFGEQTMK